MNIVFFNIGYVVYVWMDEWVYALTRVESLSLSFTRGMYVRGQFHKVVVNVDYAMT